MAGTKKDKAIGGFKFLCGAALTGVSIAFYPATFAIGTTSAIVGASIVGVGFLLQFLSKDDQKQKEERDTKDLGHNIRRVGSVAATFGVGCMLSPGIGVGIAAEGLYQTKTGQSVSIMSSLSKAVYQTGVNFKKGIPLISSVIFKTMKGNKDPGKDLKDRLNIIPAKKILVEVFPETTKYHPITTEIGDEVRSVTKDTTVTPGGTSKRPPSKIPKKTITKS